MMPTRHAIYLSDLAKAQIAEHVAWLMPRTRQHADLWFSAIHEAIGSLELWPKAHPVAEESKSFGFETRKMPYGQHVILFRVDDALLEVEILAVRHGAQRK